MRTLTLAVTIAFLGFAASAPPALAQTVVGPDAFKIVEKGQIRATSAAPIQGFLLLIEFSGKNYVCAVNGRGKVQYCEPLQW